MLRTGCDGGGMNSGKADEADFLGGGQLAADVDAQFQFDTSELGTEGMVDDTLTLP